MPLCHKQQLCNKREDCQIRFYTLYNAESLSYGLNLLTEKYNISLLMQITKNSLVTLEYTLKDENGEVLDSSVEMGPLEYIHGLGMIVPGLETALMGRDEGEELSVTVAPKDGYGEYNEKLVFKVDRKQFPPNVKIEVGMEFETEGHHGMGVRVIEVGDDSVTIDANHPLAGETLYFDIKIISSRMATDDEIAQFFSHSCSCGCGSSGEDSCGCSGCSGCH